MNLDFTGLNLTIIGVGVGALILLIIILRFAHRPKKAVTPPGLGLDPSLPAARTAGVGGGNATGTSATAAASPTPSTAAESEIEAGRMASERFFAPDRTDAAGAHAVGAAGS